MASSKPFNTVWLSLGVLALAVAFVWGFETLTNRDISPHTINVSPIGSHQIK